MFSKLKLLFYKFLNLSSINNDSITDKEVQQIEVFMPEMPFLIEFLKTRSENFLATSRNKLLSEDNSLIRYNLVQFYNYKVRIMIRNFVKVHCQEQI